jgi:hypothetical protein
MTVRSDPGRRETTRRETARREAERMRVGSSVLREGRPDRMETTTRPPDPRRLRGDAQPRRGNGPFRADPGPAGRERAGTAADAAARRVDAGRQARRAAGPRLVTDLPGNPAASGAPTRPSPRRRSRPASAQSAPVRPATAQPVTAQPVTARPAKPRPVSAPPGPAGPPAGRPVPKRRVSRRPAGEPGRFREPGSFREADSFREASSFPEVGPARYAARASLPRMPFVLLVLVLLGGGLICLLVINTTLGATSFRISRLQSTAAALATQEQALQQQIAAEQSPAQIARRAYQLGMRVQANGNILDLSTNRSYQLPGKASATVSLGAASTPSPTASPTVATTSTGTGNSGGGKSPASKSGKPSDRSGSGR